MHVMGDEFVGMTDCWVCGEESLELPVEIDGQRIACPVCGQYDISGTAIAEIIGGEPASPEQCAAMSHYIRRRQQGDSFPLITSDQLAEQKKALRFPSVVEQSDNIIEWLGNALKSPGDRVLPNLKKIAAIAGCPDEKSAKMHLSELIKADIVDESVTRLEVGGGIEIDNGIRLTHSGWLYFQEIEEQRRSSTHAFLATGYGDLSVVGFIDKCFRPAVKQTGFVLERMDENPIAGVMDNRMQLLIRQSRFLVVDITGGNNGAYWEAGYAFGMGKPVIYTCRKKEWDDLHIPDTRPHFDVNHHTSVIWEQDSPKKAEQELKDIIRNTIDEAIQSDDE